MIPGLKNYFLMLTDTQSSIGALAHMILMLNLQDKEWWHSSLNVLSELSEGQTKGSALIIL